MNSISSKNRDKSITLVQSAKQITKYQLFNFNNSVVLIIVFFLLGNTTAFSQCPAITDCTPFTFLPDNQTRQICSSPAAATFGVVVGNGSMSGSTFIPAQLRRNYNATVACALPAPNSSCIIFIVVPVQTTAPDCANLNNISGDANTTISRGQSVATSVSANGTVTWAISPTTGVSATSGSGTATGNITFSTPGTYSVTFTSRNDNGTCNTDTITSKSFTRTITVSNACTVNVKS
jgi:hypothetical protein